jgi:diphthamide synthase (EF-2-diphthine--ammonia ligase)
MSWSSGKDSTMALAAARRDDDVDVVGLLVTVNASAERVAMHAVRRSLVEMQAQRLGLPLTVIEIPEHCSNETYELKMAQAIDAARSDGVEGFVFGDLFLEDVRHYRETQLLGTGIAPLFPLWGVPTDAFARERRRLRRAGRDHVRRSTPVVAIVRWSFLRFGFSRRSPRRR